MIASAVSLALLFGFWPHPSQAAKPPVSQSDKPPPSHGRVGDWRYEVKTDNFTGGRSCALHGRDHRTGAPMTYFDGVVALRFGRLDVEDAVYWVDNGDAHASLNQAEGNLGWVFLPAASLTHAHEVVIRPAPNLSPKRVSLSGLDAALAKTAALGCAPGSFPQPNIDD